MKCKLYSKIPDEAAYFQMEEFWGDGVIALAAYDNNGKFVGYVLTLSKDGVYLCDGLPNRINIQKDNKGRVMLINDDMQAFQKTLPYDLPLERLE